MGPVAIGHKRRRRNSAKADLIIKCEKCARRERSPAAPVRARLIHTSQRASSEVAERQRLAPATTGAQPHLARHGERDADGVRSNLQKMHECNARKYLNSVRDATAACS